MKNLLLGFFFYSHRLLCFSHFDFIQLNFHFFIPMYYLFDSHFIYTSAYETIVQISLLVKCRYTQKSNQLYTVGCLSRNNCIVRIFPSYFSYFHPVVISFMPSILLFNALNQCISRMKRRKPENEGEEEQIENMKQ